MKRKLHIVLILTLSLVGLILPQAVALSATYYLDAVNGDDSNPGTETAPWRSITKAQSSVSGGDTVLLREGNYGNFTENVNRSDWITYKADTGHIPVFTQIYLGGGSADNGYLIFDGITITNMVRIYSHNYIQIKNCDIWTASYKSGESWGVYNTGRYVTVENCEIQHAARGINSYGYYFIAKNNTIHDISSDGISASGNNILIENNKIYDVRKTKAQGDDPGGWSGYHCDGMQFYSATAAYDDIVIRGNEVYGDTSEMQGIFVSANGEWTNVVIENNLIHDIDTVSAYLYVEGVVSAYVYNNTVLGVARVATVHSNPTTVIEMYNNIFQSFVFDADRSGAVAQVVNHGNNIFHNNPVFTSPNYTYGFEPNASEMVNADMATLFEDLSAQDYRLRDGSDAIDFGNPSYCPDTDILGNPRDTQPDAGCYEYVGSGNQAPTANAGSDQAITDTDGNGSEQVTLDGSASQDPDGEIVSYVWSEGGSQIATGINPTVILSTGTHLITLTVTDNGGLTDTDTVTIKVLREEKEFGELPTGCYNNVFNPTKGEEALIWVELPNQARVKVDLYNTRSKKIRELADEHRDAGPCRYYWNGKNDSGSVVGSGLYFVHIQAGDYKKTKKIVVVK